MAVSIDDILAVSPWFDDPLFKPYGPDIERTLTTEGGQLLLRVVTAAGTRPVYAVDEKDYTLTFLYHEAS